MCKPHALYNICCEVEHSTLCNNASQNIDILSEFLVFVHDEQTYVVNIVGRVIKQIVAGGLILLIMMAVIVWFWL